MNNVDNRSSDPSSLSRSLERAGERARRAPAAAARLSLTTLLLFGIFGATISHAVRAQPAESSAAESPDPGTLPDDALGRTVRYGRDLIVHTSALLGPDAPNPAMRYAGNGLECESCHLSAGTKPFGLPLTRAWAVFPTFTAREGAVTTLADRINGCFERSLNGRALPDESAEMAALLAYLRFLNERGPNQPAGAPLPLPERAAAPERGAAVFAGQCAACHGRDGLGQLFDSQAAAAQGHRYAVPPLWGPDSFNDGAGMARPITAARFVRANMPFGVDPAHPVLSVADAFDVAAFVQAQPRPHFPPRARDYPDLWQKPVDAAWPPLLGPFPAEQHRLGPWPPIQEWLHAHAPKPQGEATDSH